MRLYLEKNMRIMNELVTFCHSLGSEDYRIHFTHQVDRTIIEITAPVVKISDEVLENLITTLNLPRQREMEQNYWEISGDSEFATQMTLVGLMIDEAEVSHHDGTLFIRILRKD